jgi:transcription antitermination factor NusG
VGLVIFERFMAST